ncbi:Magnesium transporter CorA family protein [Hibiscus syriacus]|uniref:Magnesium transporter CorA family protein n=1 Tax=Hibiscus syriacus TaxID=106335 RepID=A0A6A2WCC2_HIBSY|nr:Magnesium transporter CorA family protein [Hibiscus syriacus]
MKETQEPKTRANGHASHCGVRDVSEHSFGRNRSTLNSSNELGKAAYKKENDSVAYMPYSASSKLHSTGQILNVQLYPQRLGGTSEHVAMADIVRLGRPKSKGSQMPCETPYSPQDAVPPHSTIYQMKQFLATSDSKLGTDQDSHSSDLNMISESVKKSDQHGFDNEWTVNGSMIGSGDGTMYSNQSDVRINKANMSSNFWSDSILVSESNVGRKNLSPNHVSSAQVSNKQIFTSDSGKTSEYNEDLRKDTSSPDYDYLRKDTSSPDSYEQIYQRLEGSNASPPNSSAPLSNDATKAASSVSVNLQHLSLGKEEGAATPKENNCGVVLPDYFQALSVNCSHLSFGTYKSGKSTALPQPQTSSSLTNKLEEILMSSNGCSTSMHLNSRNLSELRKLDIPDAATLGNDYVSHASILGSSFKNVEQSSSSFVIDPNARNLPTMPQSHSNSMPSDILAPAIQSIEARDSAAYLTSPSFSSRCIGSASSIKNPTVSMSQISAKAGVECDMLLIGAVLSAFQSFGHNFGYGRIFSCKSSVGTSLQDNRYSVRRQEHLYAYAYAQSDYPTAPQCHTYTPSALRQAFPVPDGNVFCESHTDRKYDLRHCGSASMSSSLPWSSSKLAYDDFLRSQYGNSGANFNLPHQNDGSATWGYGHGSRTISTIPDNANYSLHGRNHQLAGFQHSQQLHGALGYSGVYSSHAAMATEQQQRNFRNMILNASQGPLSRQISSSMAA